jgi:peptide/nickel transport system substrate-binding protein
MAMLAVLSLAACSSDDGDAAEPAEQTQTSTTTSDSTSSSSTTSSTQAEPQPTAMADAPADSMMKASTAAAQEQYELFPEDGIPQYGGQFRVAATVPRSLQMIDNPDASVFEFGYLVYDTLFFQDWRTGTHSVTGEIEPNVVETWELANDGRTYTFTLVEGIKFHDGTDFDATDVKASMDFYADPGDVAPPGGSLVGPNKPVTTIVDSHTVTIAIAEASPIFLTQLSSNWAPMFASDDIAQGLDFLSNNANGTGPFIFNNDAWERGVSMEYVKNDNFRIEGLPYLDSVRQVELAEAAEVAAFETQNIDFTPDAPPDQAQDIKNRFGDEVDAIKMLTGGHSYGILNTRFAPFDNPNVRRAVYLWVDRQQIIDNALNGGATLCAWICPDYHSGFGTPRDQLVQNNLAFRPDKAEARAEALRILAEEGVDPSAFEITVLARYTSGGGLASNQVLTAQLRDMGWNAKLESLDRTAGLEKLNDGGGWHAAYYGGASPLHEPDGTLARYVAPAGQRHYAGADDPKYDALLQTILTTVDPAGRRAAIDAMDAYLQEGTFPQFPIAWAERLVLKWNWVHAMRHYSAGWSNDLERTWLSENAPGR